MPRTATTLLHRLRGGGVPPALVAVVVLLPVLLLGFDLGTPSLWDPDEGRHAEIGREMVLTDRWWSPQLNFLPYREKPPAYYWLLASALSLLGAGNEAAARLPSVLLALPVVWIALAWGWRHLRPAAGLLAGFVLGTAAGWVGTSRLAIDEVPAGALLSIALFAMSGPLVGSRRRFPWAFWTTLAAAVLVAGATPVWTALAVALVFVALVREPGRLLDLRPFRGAGLVLALVLPPLALTAAHDPEYVAALARSESPLAWASAFPEAVRSHSPLLRIALVPVLLLPWGIFLPWALRDALRSGGERSPDARPYLAAWLAVATASLALLESDMTYAFTAMPPLALLTGRWLVRVLRRPAPRSILSDPILVGAAALFAAVFALPMIAYRALEAELPTYADKIVYVFLLIPFALGGLGAVVARARSATIGAVALSGIVTILGTYRFGSATVSAYNSMEFPANLIAAALPPPAPIVSYGTLSHTLSFYSGRAVHPLDDLAGAAELLNGDAAVALLTKERFLPEVRAQIESPLYVWWEGDSKKVLLANLPPPRGGDRRILLPAAAVARAAAPAEAAGAPGP